MTTDCVLCKTMKLVINYVSNELTFLENSDLEKTFV